MELREIRLLNLRRLLEKRFGGVVAQFARAIGKDRNQARFILNPDKSGGRWLGEKQAREIEDALGLPRLALDYLDSDQSPADANVSAGPDRKGRVPLISWVRAGDFAFAADLKQPGDAFEWIDTGVSVHQHTFALRVEGDSMEPEFSHGTIIIVEPQLDAQPGNYVVVKNGNHEATFKQLVRDGADLYLKPLNDRYPIKPLGTATIVGVVREAVKRYR